MISYRLDPIHRYCFEGLVINISMNCELTVLWCCLKSLWWYVLISFACKLCEKLLQIYHHTQRGYLKVEMLSWTLFNAPSQENTKFTAVVQIDIKSPLPYCRLSSPQKKPYQLSHKALERCSRNVRTVSADTQSLGLAHFSGVGYHHLAREFFPLEKTISW